MVDIDIGRDLGICKFCTEDGVLDTLKLQTCLSLRFGIVINLR